MLARYELKQGEGAPYVFLHGFLGSAQDWSEVVKTLTKPCISFDLPGHGNSPFTADFFQALERSTKNLLSFHLVGYSMGGRLAAQFAKKYPQKIQSLTLISTHLGLKSTKEKEQRLIRDQSLAESILSLSIEQFLLTWYDQPLFGTINKKMDICSKRQNQNKEDLAKALLAFSLGLQDDCSNVPAHYLIGAEDTMYRQLYEHIPHTIIPNAGHAVHLENPHEIARYL